MDFDPASTPNSAQAALYAIPSQQAGRSVAAASPPSPRLATQANPSARQRPTTYHDLPPEILQRVAAHMPLYDIPDLSAVDRRTYHALKEWRLSWFCTRNADEVRLPDLASVQRLLAEIKRIRAEPTLRAKPLQTLSKQLSGLPEEQQTAAFQQVFEAAGRVPRQGLQLQKNMIESIVCFQRGYELAYADAERRHPEQGSTWAALASVRKEFPIDPLQFATEYRAFVSRLPALNPAEQAELIVELAKLLIEFVPNHYPTATTIAELYETLTQWVQRLPVSYRGAPIGALADSIWLLSEEQKSLYYANLRHWTLSLPDHQLGEALRYLSSSIADLPSAQQAHELSRLEPIIERVLPEQRALVSIGLIRSTLGLDEGLAKQAGLRALSLLDSSNEAIQRMPSEQRALLVQELIFSTVRLNEVDEALSQQVWQRALRALDNCDPGDVFKVFFEFEHGTAILLFSDQQWKDAKTEIRAFIERNCKRYSGFDRLLQGLEHCEDSLNRPINVADVVGSWTDAEAVPDWTLDNFTGTETR
jgi:hypothetical protein